MALIGILIIIVGFALKFNTIAVVIVSGLVTGLVSGMSISEILTTLGQTFVQKREMCLFLLTLPVVGMCERYGLKEKAIMLIKNVKGLSTGKIISGYLFIRELSIAMAVKLGGHPQFVRPLINPMAQGAAISKYGEIDKKYEDKIIAYRNDIYIDIVPLGCSKGNGIKYIAKQEFIKDDYIYTIGDSWNDVTMFNITKNSFTFHHVEEELKEHASYLVDSVADCIEEHIL